MDEDLRALERLLERDDSVEVRLRLSRMLVREGSLARAYLVLIPSREEVAARNALVDVCQLASPPRSAPRLKWRRSCSARPPLVASPLGIACGREVDEDRWSLQVLDTETGEVRWDSEAVGISERDWGLGACVVGPMLLAWREDLASFDLWTGRELGRASLPLHVWAHAVAPGRFFTSQPPRLKVFALDPPHPVVQTMAFGSNLASEEAAVTELVAWGDHIYAYVDGHATAKLRNDDLTNAPAWVKGRVKHADTVGFLVEQENALHASTHADSPRLWSCEGRFLAANELLVLVERGYQPVLVQLVERSTGRTVGTLLSRRTNREGVWRIEGDIAIGAEDDTVLRAFDAEARETWSVSLSSPLTSIATLPGRAYVLTHDGAVACFEESSGVARSS